MTTVQGGPSPVSNTPAQVPDRRDEANRAAARAAAVTPASEPARAPEERPHTAARPQSHESNSGYDKRGRAPTRAERAGDKVDRIA